MIKNTYRTLLTRGMKGCYVYFVDDEAAAFFRSRLGESGVESVGGEPVAPGPGAVRYDAG